MVGELMSVVENYTKRGWVVHPLSAPDDKGNSPGKKPILPKWQFLTKTPDNISEYLKKGCNIGLVCGKASGVDALDFDIDLFNDDLFNGFEPVTLMSGHRDGRGHILFQHRDDIFSEKHHFIGIEYFGNNKEGAGSNLVLPPSMHYSGEVYKWNDPAAPIMKIPDRLKDNIVALFKKEDALHEYFKKCRHCFTKGSKKYAKEDPRSKGLWDRPDNIAVHGMEGRRVIIAIMGELRNVGCPDDLMHMACKRFFGKDYSFKETADALKHIKPIPPKCETLRQYLNVECEGCAWKPSAAVKKETVFGDKFCGTCFYCPAGQLGGCRNIKNNDEKDKKRWVEGTDPACDKYKYREKGAKKLDKVAKKLNLEKLDPELEKAMGMYTDRLQLAEELQKIIPFYFDESRNYWMWKKDLKYYKLIDETDILSCVRCNSREYVVNSTLKNEILEGIRITGRERPVAPVEKNWLRFNDLVYDLDTKQTFEPKPTHFYSTPIPHNLGKSFETPTIDKLFTDWMGDQKEMLYEIAAYCLLDAYPIHRMFILFGGGGNGKSQFMDFLTQLVGENNTTTTDLDTLMTSRFESAKLYKKKLALVGETNFSTIKDTATIKKLTGSDRVSGEFKHKKPFEFLNTAKVIISSNSVPENLDKTDAFYRRTIILEFKNKFTVGTPIIDTIPEIEYENFIKKVIEHYLPELLKSGVFKDEGTIEQKTEKYEKLADPFSTFKNKELIEDVDSDIPVWVLREMFFEYCTRNNYRRLGEKEFTQTLNRAGIETKKKRFGEKTWNAVIGFRTKNPRVWSITDSNNVTTCSTSSTTYHKISHIGKEVGLAGTGGTPGTNEIISKLKEKYDSFHKPDSILDLGRMQKTMEGYLLNELEGSEDVFLMQFVEDYCRSRGWC